MVGRMSWLALGVAWTVLVSSGAADVIVLSDGTRIVGTVQSLAGGKLVVKTRLVGTLTIDTAEITSLQTDQPVNVQTGSGEYLVGTVQPGDGDRQVVVRSDDSAVPLALEHLDTMWPLDAKSPQALAAQRERPKWSATAEAGAIRKQGNSDILDARGRFDLRRKGRKNLLAFYVAGEFSEENEQRSAAEIKGGVSYEHLLNERFFAFAKADLEYDEFENLDLRLIATAGGGYYWIKQPHHELKTRVGLGYQHERFGSVILADETVVPGFTTDGVLLDIGLDYRWDICSWLQLTHQATYYPTFESIRDYRLVFDTALIIPLAASDAWKLKIGALYEYDPIPQVGSEPLDETYYVNILLDLK